MKKTLITVAVLVLVYPVVAWLMGFAIEQRVEGLADQGQLMVPRLHLIQKTRHGVLTSDEDSSYELGSTLKVTRHYHRGWYTSTEEATVEMSRGGLDGTMHYGAQQDWYDTAASAPSLHLEGAKGTLEIDGMSLGLRGKRLLRTLYAGDSRMEMKRLSVTGTDKAPQFTVNDLLIANQNRAQDRFMSVSYQLGAGAIVTQPLTLSSAHIDLTWKHLGLESLDSLITAMRPVGEEQDTSVTPAARAQRMMAALKQPLEALLVEQPEMDVDRVSGNSRTGRVYEASCLDTDGYFNRWPATSQSLYCQSRWYATRLVRTV